MSQAPNSSSAISAAQIERIVREVLSALSSSNSAPSVQASSTLRPLSHGADQATGKIRLNVAVLSLENLRSIAKDTKEIAVPSGALVTPAARDYLREKGITWTRTDESKGSDSNITHSPVGVAEKKGGDSAPKRLFVTGSVLWLRNLEKQLCPKASLVDQVQIDDAAAVRSVAQAIRSGVHSAVVIVKAPHSTLWQAARDEALRPAVISQWSDLVEVFREVPTNMLIVPSTRWNIAGTANIARKFLEFIQANR